MSKWSHVSDLYDFLQIGWFFENEERARELVLEKRIFCGDKRIFIKSIEDLIPYYTHIIEDIQDDSIILSEYSYFDIHESEYYLTTDMLERIIEFDKYVKSFGFDPIWRIPLSDRLQYKKCPYGTEFFCEPNIQKNNKERRLSKMCPFMRADRSPPCSYKKYLDRIALKEQKRKEKKK